MTKAIKKLVSSLTKMNEIDYQILDAIEASIYWKDLEGRYLGCNKYMLKMAGLSREELIGNTDYLLPWKSEANKIREVDELVINNKRKYEFEERGPLADGSDILLLSAKSPLLNEAGEVAGVIGVSIDITHNKKFENEFAKTEESLSEYSSIKTRFLRNISHEARIPMGSVLSLAESLHSSWDKYDDQLKKESVDLIYKEAQRLSRFVLNTFDMSNFIQGKIQPSFTKGSLSQLVRDVTLRYKQSLYKEKADIRINNFDEYVIAFDKKLITRVIENLLMNAVQYSPKHKKITVDLHKSYLKDSSVPAIHCCIKDEGIGVPEAELQAIFDSFTESSATASKACGIGLGLSICKEIIDLHSGEIWAENNSLTKGSTFNFCIPTTLFSFSESLDDENVEEVERRDGLISYRELSKLYQDEDKRSFALIVISPFNSYFSSEKIFEILEWIHKHYVDFAVFFPDKISKYTLEASGYEASKVHQKVRKQDNHTLNRINNALALFYEKHNYKKEVIVHTISSLKNNEQYQRLYTKYLNKFYTDKNFRQECMGISEWVLSKSEEKQEGEHNEFNRAFAAHTAVNYFLFEFPITIDAPSVLDKESCDFVYHAIPKHLKSIYNNYGLVAKNQGFLVLK